MDKKPLRDNIGRIILTTLFAFLVLVSSAHAQYTMFGDISSGIWQVGIIAGVVLFVNVILIALCKKNGINHHFSTISCIILFLALMLRLLDGYMDFPEGMYDVIGAMMGISIFVMLMQFAGLRVASYITGHPQASRYHALEREVRSSGGRYGRKERRVLRDMEKEDRKLHNQEAKRKRKTARLFAATQVANTLKLFENHPTLGAMSKVLNTYTRATMAQEGADIDLIDKEMLDTVQEQVQNTDEVVDGGGNYWKRRRHLKLRSKELEDKIKLAEINMQGDRKHLAVMIKDLIRVAESEKNNLSKTENKEQYKALAHYIEALHEELDKAILKEGGEELKDLETLNQLYEKTKHLEKHRFKKLRRTKGGALAHTKKREVHLRNHIDEFWKEAQKGEVDRDIIQADAEMKSEDKKKKEKKSPEDEEMEVEYGETTAGSEPGSTASVSFGENEEEDEDDRKAREKYEKKRRKELGL